MPSLETTDEDALVRELSDIDARMSAGTSSGADSDRMIAIEDELDRRFREETPELQSQFDADVQTLETAEREGRLEETEEELFGPDIPESEVTLALAPVHVQASPERGNVGWLFLFAAVMGAVVLKTKKRKRA